MDSPLPPHVDMEPFEPGDERRFVHPSRWGGRIRPPEAGASGSVCEVEVPGRLHASVLDMNRFDVGSPGGGGIGFAVALFCRARVVLGSGRGIQATGGRPGLAFHLARLFTTISGWDGSVEIELLDHERRHMGLGSSIGTITAGAVALNEALGRPFSVRDLRKLVAHNYCEEVPGDPRRLVAGFETNVGAMAAIHGGMVLASDSCELVYRIPLPDTMRALLILPATGPEVASGEQEAQALLTRAQAGDRRDARAKAYHVLMDLLPAMIQGDLDGVGRTIHQLARLGSKRAECRLHGRQGREIYRMMDALRAEGAEIVCMSSVGPAVFALSRRPEVWRCWQRWRKGGAAACTLEVPVENSGARVRLDGVPIPYRLEPWWQVPDYPPQTEPRDE